MAHQLTNTLIDLGELMGVRLMVEMLDHAPADLSPAERLVLVAIAEDIRDEGDRTGCPGVDLLCRRTGLSEEGLRKAFQRLSQRGLEVRVPLGVGKKGKLIFAKPGVRTTYRLPTFKTDPDEWQYSGPKVRDESTAKEGGWQYSGPEHRDERPEHRDESTAPPPSSPSSPNTYGATEDDDFLQQSPPQSPPKKKAPKQDQKKSTHAPDEFPITDSMRAWAKEKVPTVDIDFETPQFLDRHRSKGNTFKDWTSAWRTWMRNSVRFAEERQQRQGQLRVVNGQGTNRTVKTHAEWDSLTEEEVRNLI